MILFLNKASANKISQVIIHQLADALDGDVGRRVGGDDLGVERVMPLAREDGRQPVSPDVFHRGEYSQLVVHYYVTARRVSPLNVIEHQLFVNVDQYAPFDGVPQT